MPFLDCFGKKHKEPRVPPPSRESVDRPAIVQRPDIEEEQAAPPLPNRYVETPTSNHRPDDYQHSQRIPINQSPGSPVSESHGSPNQHTDGSEQRKSNIPVAKQLSSEVLSTRVPLEPPEPVRQDPIGEESGEDYLDPQNKLPLASSDSVFVQDEPEPNKATATNRRQKFIASISEEKRSDILSDYFDSSAKRPVTPERAIPTIAESCPIYTNMTEVAAALSSPGQTQSTRNFNLPVTPQAKASVDSNAKPTRIPKPMPRNLTESEGSSRKHSLTNSDSDDSAFAYENIGKVLEDLPKSPIIENASPITPKPMPRPRADHKASNNHRNVAEEHHVGAHLFQPVPSPQLSPARLSPLQKRVNAQEGYITDAEYVPPEQFSTLGRPSTPSKPSTPSSTSSTGAPNQSPVDLHAPVPKLAVDAGLVLPERKQGYLPMDQSSKTKAQPHKHDQEDDSAHIPPQAPSHNKYDLNIKIPVGNINDVHVPGYITVLGERTAPMVSGNYQNISQQSDYINANISGPTVQARHHNAPLPDPPTSG